MTAIQIAGSGFHLQIDRHLYRRIGAAGHAATVDPVALGLKQRMRGR